MKGIKDGLTRRGFLKSAALIGLIITIIPDMLLLPKRLLAATVTGRKAANPITVTVNHPMTADHYIKSIYIVDDLSPIPSKGLYRFTPANGEAYRVSQKIFLPLITQMIRNPHFLSGRF